jgi:hypothetical protein
MENAVWFCGWDTMVLMVPFVVVLVMAMLHVDELLATPKQSPRARRFFCGVDPQDLPYMSDPDGRPWRKNRVRQIEARLAPAYRSDWSDSAS